MRMPAPLVEVAGPVVPPGEDARLVEAREHVGESPVLDVAQRGPLGLAHVGRPDEVRPGSHTSPSSGATLKSPHTATESPGRQVSSSMVRSRASHSSLNAVELVVEAAAVGHVDRVHPHAAARRRHDAAPVLVLGGAEPAHRVVQPDPAERRPRRSSARRRGAPTRSPARRTPRRGTCRRPASSPAGRARRAVAPRSTAVTRGSRAVSELTFQVARRIRPPRRRR